MFFFEAVELASTSEIKAQLAALPLADELVLTSMSHRSIQVFSSGIAVNKEEADEPIQPRTVDREKKA